MRTLADSHGFTLMEILIAMMLIAAVGVASMYAFASTAQVTQNDENVAYNVGRGYMEQFYERVRQDQWGTGGLPLSLTNIGRPPIVSKTLNGDTYQPTYTVNGNTQVMLDANGDGEEDYRRVQMTVTWT